jgi:hypothetical protein
MKAAMLAVLAAGIACAPLAQADPCNNQACLQKSFAEAGGPYIGSWGAHKEGVTVGSDGSGTEISDYGTVTFKMNSVSTQEPTAYGGVVNGGGRISTGAYMTMQLVDGGNGMLFSMGGGDQGFPFCKIVNGSKVNSADCGA